MAGIENDGSQGYWPKIKKQVLRQYYGATTFSIMTLKMMGLFVKLSINDISIMTLSIKRCYAECCDY